MVSLCPLGEHIFHKTNGPCPALEWEKMGHSRCGLIHNPGRYAPTHYSESGKKALSEGAAFLVGANMGCDLLEEGELRPRGFLEKWFEYRRIYKVAIKKAKRVWKVE